MMNNLVTIYAIGAGCIALAIAYLIGSLYNGYKFFELRGIKGPKPILLFGNLHLLISRNLGHLSREWVATYGRMTGFFFAWTPRLIVADAETVNQICIKDFDVFTDRFLMRMMDKYQEKFVFLLQGDRWRKVRAFMSPTFTSGKIRRMYKLLEVCADDLVAMFQESLGHATRLSKQDSSAIVNVKDLFSLYTIDAIASCCYGMKMDRSNLTANQDKLTTTRSRNEFVELCRGIFRFSKVRLFATWLLPQSILRFFGFTVLSPTKVAKLAAIVSDLLEARRNSSRSKRFDDYLQLLIDSNLDDAMNLDHVDQAEHHHAALSHESLKADQKKLVESVTKNKGEGPIGSHKDLCLTDLEILSNAMFLLLVGLETTASLLSSCVYTLAFHPDIQDRLYREIKCIAQVTTRDRDDEEIIRFDYEALTTNKYLDAVISETLRTVPTVYMVDRNANRDYHFEKWNFSIPKNTVLFIGIHAIHHDPEYWPEPDKFNPERFMPENRDKIEPGSYCPFGIGPRHCVGMRFSLTETKLALAKLIMQFRFDPAPRLTYPPEPSSEVGTTGPRDPLVTLKSRHSSSNHQPKDGHQRFFDQLQNHVSVNDRP